jgi:hypothetical protein
MFAVQLGIERAVCQTFSYGCYLLPTCPVSIEGNSSTAMGKEMYFDLILQEVRTVE